MSKEIVCVCEDITKDDIIKAIKKGFTEIPPEVTIAAKPNVRSGEILFAHQCMEQRQYF